MITRIQIIKRYFRSLFDLKGSQEDELETDKEVREGVVFKGKNLWLLAFAIFISCIGLNINSKAAVIGAMIISPLMGPIFGIGFSLGVSDLDLLKVSIQNALRIVLISLIVATIYYLITPYAIATDELLSFSHPTIFDVLLAFLGGMAGFIAISRHNGTQVLIGVAVATSCIPPLCTASFGLATLQWEYFVGGLYTYFINALFICVGSYIIVKYLKFSPHSKENVKNVNIWFGVLIFLAIIPAMYLAYNFAITNIFISKANQFVTNEIDTKHHVVQSKIDFKNKLIEVDVTVEKYDDSLQKIIEKQLQKTDLKDSKIKIYQTIEAGRSNRAEFDKLNAEIELLRNEINKIKNK
ncbi:DUF389 domain-containing protein [Flavobacterium sp.]|uniref:DUF389 domain-containing protein n=1 Tax=Flavobacterium sp. TaxID=239 RepID=UPI00260B0B8E|nr:DUF389 domain-containing protein [Flavobacterium sp.]